MEILQWRSNVTALLSPKICEMTYVLCSFILKYEKNPRLTKVTQIFKTPKMKIK